MYAIAHDYYLDTNTKKISPYVKVEIYSISSQFQNKKLSSSSRHIFRSMAAFIKTVNSDISKFTYDEMLNETGFKSRNVISQSLKELIEKGFIEKIDKSRYKILVGMYNGTTELQEYKPKKKSIRSILSRTRVHVLNKNKKTTKKDDSYLKLRIDKKKPFSIVKPKSLNKFIDQFTFKKVQEVILRLETVYVLSSQIRVSATGLLYKALSEDYVIENKQEEEQKKREERAHRTEREVRKIKDQEKEDCEREEKEENIKVNDLMKNEILVQKVKNIISLKHPSIPKSGFVYDGLFRSYLLSEGGG